VNRLLQVKEFVKNYMHDGLINEKFNAHKIRLQGLLQRLEGFTLETESRPQQETVRALRKNLDEPFLFVVVGEVKSGKSSFINALLQDGICKVDPAPCTDRVQQILYAEKKSDQAVSPHLTKIGLPLEILKTIAIVDTPGTNTVVANHQELTEKFIPLSDLVIFVFPARNPHTQSAWNLLDFVSAEWRRKVIFVLQQADTASAHELEVNQKSVRDYAAQRQIAAPQIFSTSAKLEQENAGQGGFEAMRAFIRQTVTGGRHFSEKLQSNIASARQLVSTIQKSLEAQKQQLEADVKIQEKVKNRLSLGKGKSAHEIDGLIDRLALNYGHIANTIKNEFREGLSLTTVIGKSLAAIFRKDHSLGNWVNDLNQRFDEKLRSTIEEVSTDGAQSFIEGIHLLLHELLDTLENSRLPRSREAEFLIKVGESRQKVIEAIMAKVANLMKNDTFANFLNVSAQIDQVGAAFKGGGALAIIGGVIAFFTHTAAFDITGGALTTSGVLLAGGTLVVKRNSILKKFNESLDKNEDRFRWEIKDKLTEKLRSIYEAIDGQFEPLYVHIANEQKRLLPQIERGETLAQEFEQLAGEIIVGK
jgi:ribosome biogenesis GTPase A